MRKMAKQGEIDYLKNIGEAGVRHAVNKPFSDAGCDRYLVEIGTVMSLLPPPPARLLDLGCGTGWSSIFFAKRGYEVVGVDICADMIHHARQNREARVLDNLQFQVSDYEELRFDDEFDCAVFFDSLHHAVDEALAIRKTFAALRHGGICVASEPGKGHQDAAWSLEAVQRFNTTEKDMHPDKVIGLARQAGFREFKAYPHAFDLNHLMKSQFDFAEVESLKLTFAKAPFWTRVKRRLGWITIAPGREGYCRVRWSQFVVSLHQLFANVGNSGVVQMIK